MTLATSGRAFSTSIGQAISHNNSLSNDFQTAADRYLIPFIVVALIAVVVFTYGVFISRQAYRGKMAIKDLELTIALKEATNRQPASTSNVSSGEKTEQSLSAKATAKGKHIGRSSGATHSSDADLADGNYAAVQPKAPFWASTSYVDSSRLSTYHQPAGHSVPLEVIVSAASETNSEDMVDENKKQTVFGSFDDGETELTPSAMVIYSQPFRKSRSIAPSPETRGKIPDSRIPESSDEETPAVPRKNHLRNDDFPFCKSALTLTFTFTMHLFSRQNVASGTLLDTRTLHRSDVIVLNQALYLHLHNCCGCSCLKEEIHCVFQ